MRPRQTEIRTLSLDLRGFGIPRGLSGESPARDAGVSALFHALGISTLILIPLMTEARSPEARNRMAGVFVEPVVIASPALPPPPRAHAPRTRAAAVSSERRPEDRPAPPIRALLVPAVANDASPGDAGPIGPPGDRNGECALGAVCGDAPSPSIDTRPNDIVRIGPTIREPRLIDSRAPQFPPLALQAGQSGRVVIEAQVGRDGRIVRAQVVRGHTLFNESALASVRSRRYEPLLLSGVPTEFITTITVIFTATR